MLRGLAIRQLFVLTNWVLATLIVLGALGLAASALYKARHAQSPSGKPGTEAAAASAKPLATVKPRAAYDAIMASGIFGPGAQATTDAPAAPAAPTAPEAETQLRLKLIGTAATTPKDPFASAVIMNQENNSIKTFAVGQAVVENVTLEEIHRRKVIIFNKRTNRREVLRNEESEDDQSQLAANAAPGTNTAPPPPRVRIKKQELYDQVLSNYADLAAQLKPELAHDANGNVTGITANNIESIPIAETLKLKNGDVLQSVNNERIDSEAKILEIVQKYQGTSSFSVDILRNGKKQTMTYNLE